MTNFYPKTPTQKVNANIEAIKLVKELANTNRQASPQEQETLARYVGWGGLANTFFDENLKRFEGQRETLKNLVSLSEYAEMRQSSLTAYYTDPEIVKNIYHHLEEQGFNNNDTTKLIRVAINDWKGFSTLSLFENTTRLELFSKLLNHYVENTENLSEVQRSLILNELQKETADND